jgi:DHA2 family lincomycin resistance protein-like MFS transporter
MAVVIPITGWLMQRLNTRPVFITAMSTFSVGTLIAALSPVFELLIVGRVVQAIGTAIMMPLMMTTVMTIVAPHERGRIMGRISVVMSVAPALGPVVSGALLQVLPWQGLFWVMLPIASRCSSSVRSGCRTCRRPAVHRSTCLRHPVGHRFSTLVYGLSSIGYRPLSAPPGGAVGADHHRRLVLAVFVWRQLVLQRTDSALLDLRTFTSRNFTLSIALLATAMLALFGTVIVLPQFARYTLGLDTHLGRALLLRGGLLMGLLGPTVGRLFDKVGPRPLIIPGARRGVVSMWIMAFGLGEGSSWVVLLIAYITLCLGLAFLFTPLFSTSWDRFRRSCTPTAARPCATLQQVAGAAGAAVFVALYATGLAAAGNLDPEHPSASEAANGSHLAFVAGGIISLVVVLIATFITRPRDAPGARRLGRGGRGGGGSESADSI